MHTTRSSVFNTLVALLLACILGVGMLPSSAAYADSSVNATFQSDGIWYTVTSEATVSVGQQHSSGTEYAADSGSVTIPESVEHDGTTYTVTAINNYAFSQGADAGSAITSITIPQTVISIGNYAFGGCNQLAEVTFAENSTLESIGKYAFANCASLDNVLLPVSVTSLGNFCFYGCAALSSFEFEDVYSTENELQLGESVFRSSSSNANSLVSITLPARLASIPAYTFEGQTALETVTFTGSIEYIGMYAFRYCTDLTEFTFPELTSETLAVKTGAFYGCENLTKLVFESDAPSDISNSYFVKESATYGSTKEPGYTVYEDIDTIVYFGAHTTTLFSEANHYNTVYFYASEEAMEQGGAPLAYACIRDDTLISDIKSSLAASDSQGAVIYEGSIPELSDEGSWYFADYNQDETLSQSTKCYLVDPYNITYANFIGLEDEYAYTGNSIDLSYTVRGADSAVLTQGRDYQVSITDDSGKTIAAQDVTDIGTYAITITGLGNYTGTLSHTFTVGYAECTWTLLAGDTRYDTMAEIVATGFTSSDTDTVIVASGENFADALAASALAGARNAPIVLTDSSSLSLQAKGQLRTLNPQYVIIVGGGASVSDAVKQEISDALPSTTRVTRLSGSDRCATALSLYTRTLSNGYWDDSSTAIIATGTTYADALSVSSYAYVTSSPIFLTNSQGLLNQDAVAALTSSSFERIVIVGGTASVSESVKDQLGSLLTYERWSGDNRYETSMAIVQNAVSEGVLSYENIAIATGENYPDALAAAALCGKNAAPLLLVSSSNTKGIDEIIAANRYSIRQGYFLGGEASLPAAVRDKVTALFENVVIEGIE